MEKLAVLVVNYHSTEEIAALKASLDKQNTDFKWSFHVKDNDDDNVGFGAGINAIARDCNAKYMLILNPDTLLIQEDILQKMVDYANAHEDIVAFTPRLVDSAGLTQWSFGKRVTLLTLLIDKPMALLYKYFHTNKLMMSILKRICVKYDFDHYHDDIDWIAGTAMFMKTSVFKEVGGFDENIFMYYEDIDLCLRLRDRNYKLAYLPDISVIHLVGQSHSSLGSKSDMYYESQEYFFKKHYGRYAQLLLRILRFPYRLLKLKYLINRY